MIVGQLQKHLKGVWWPCLKQIVQSWCAKRAVRRELRKRQQWMDKNINKQSSSRSSRSSRSDGVGADLKNMEEKKTGNSRSTGNATTQPLSEHRLKQAEEEAWTEARMPVYNTFNDYAGTCFLKDYFLPAGY